MSRKRQRSLDQTLGPRRHGSKGSSRLPSVSCDDLYSPRHLGRASPPEVGLRFFWDDEFAVDRRRSTCSDGSGPRFRMRVTISSGQFKAIHITKLIDGIKRRLVGDRHLAFQRMQQQSLHQISEREVFELREPFQNLHQRLVHPQAGLNPVNCQTYLLATPSVVTVP